MGRWLAGCRDRTWASEREADGGQAEEGSAVAIEVSFGGRAAPVVQDPCLGCDRRIPPIRTNRRVESIELAF